MVQAVAGGTHLGGKDSRQRTIHYFAKGCNEENVDFAKISKATELRGEERAKETLSSREPTELKYKGFFKCENVSKTLRRADLKNYHVSLQASTVASRASPRGFLRSMGMEPMTSLLVMRPVSPRSRLGLRLALLSFLVSGIKDATYPLRHW